MNHFEGSEGAARLPVVFELALQEQRFHDYDAGVHRFPSGGRAPCRGCLAMSLLGVPNALPEYAPVMERALAPPPPSAIGEEAALREALERLATHLRVRHNCDNGEDELRALGVQPQAAPPATEERCTAVMGTGTTWVCNQPRWGSFHRNVENARPGSGKHDFKPPATPPTPTAPAADKDAICAVCAYPDDNWRHDTYRNAPSRVAHRFVPAPAAEAEEKP